MQKDYYIRLYWCSIKSLSFEIIINEREHWFRCSILPILARWVYSKIFCITLLITAVLLGYHKYTNCFASPPKSIKSHYMCNGNFWKEHHYGNSEMHFKYITIFTLWLYTNFTLVHWHNKESIITSCLPVSAAD